MPKDQILIGGSVAALCLIGFWKEQWFLTETRKGQRLIDWFGEARAPWVFRALLSAGTVFGVMLAVNYIRPVQW